MKILLDPIYSNPLPTCSTAYKCRAIVELAAERGKTDWFFYWPIPASASAEERAWLPQTANVRYLEVPVHKDRVREYLRYHTDLDRLQAFNGELWDFDVLWTVRSSMVANARAVMASPRQKALGRRLKKVILCEEMIMLRHKASIPLSDVEAQELLTLSGYLASDVVFIATQKERHAIAEIARKYFSPSRVREILEKLHHVVALTLREPEAKAEVHRFRGVPPVLPRVRGPHGARRELAR